MKLKGRFLGLQSASFGPDGACVAVVGDEGLDMPCRAPDGAPLFGEAHAAWLVDVVNDKHARNWAKTARFEAAVRASVATRAATRRAAPGRLRFDAVGDVACLRRPLRDSEDGAALSSRILAANRKLRLVVAPRGTADLAYGAARAPAAGLARVAGAARSPLVTTHAEHGVAVVVDLDRCFFSPRLATERLRVSKAVGRGERVLCLFAGCGPEVLVLAAKTAAKVVVAVDANAVAIRCLRRSLETLRRSRGADVADRVRVVEGDVLADLAARESRGEQRGNQPLVRTGPTRPRNSLSERDLFGSFASLFQNLEEVGGRSLSPHPNSTMLNVS